MLHSTSASASTPASALKRSAGKPERKPRSSPINIAWIATLAVVFTLFGWNLAPRNQAVMLPMMALTATYLIFLYVLQRRDGGDIPFFEVGVFYGSLVILYALFPTIGYVVRGETFYSTHDPRLRWMQPTVTEMGDIAWYMALFFASYVVFYLWGRGNLPRREVPFKKPTPSTLVLLLVIYGVLRLFLLTLGFFFQLREADNYMETFTVYRDLPLLVRQLAGQASFIVITFEIALLVFLMQDFKKYRVVVLVWMVTELVVAISNMGDRGRLFTLGLSFAAVFHQLVKPATGKIVALEASLAIVLFLSIGLQRRDVQVQGGPSFLISTFSYTTEFDNIYANALEMKKFQDAGKIVGIVLPQLYYNDLLRLVPNQFSPIKKLDLSQWYVETYYPIYAEHGGAYAFGVISEAILGYGWIDLLGRGALTGFILGKLHRRFVVGPNGFWDFVFYIWLLVTVYQAFRTTTLVLLLYWVYRFIIPVTVLETIGRLLPKAPRSKAPRWKKQLRSR